MMNCWKKSVKRRMMTRRRKMKNWKMMRTTCYGSLPVSGFLFLLIHLKHCKQNDSCMFI